MLGARWTAVRILAGSTPVQILDPVRDFRSDDRDRFTRTALQQLPPRGQTHFLHNTNKRTQRDPDTREPAPFKPTVRATVAVSRVSEIRCARWRVRLWFGSKRFVGPTSLAGADRRCFGRSQTWPPWRSDRFNFNFSPIFCRKPVFFPSRINGNVPWENINMPDLWNRCYLSEKFAVGFEQIGLSWLESWRGKRELHQISKGAFSVCSSTPVQVCCSVFSQMWTAADARL